MRRKKGETLKKKENFCAKMKKKSESGHYKYIEENDFISSLFHTHTHTLFLIAFLSNNLILN